MVRLTKRTRPGSRYGLVLKIIGVVFNRLTHEGLIERAKGCGRLKDTTWQAQPDQVKPWRALKACLRRKVSPPRRPGLARHSRPMVANAFSTTSGV